MAQGGKKKKTKTSDELDTDAKIRKIAGHFLMNSGEVWLKPEDIRSSALPEGFERRDDPRIYELPEDSQRRAVIALELKAAVHAVDAALYPSVVGDALIQQLVCAYVLPLYHTHFV